MVAFINCSKTLEVITPSSVIYHVMSMRILKRVTSGNRNDYSAVLALGFSFRLTYELLYGKQNIKQFSRER